MDFLLDAQDIPGSRRNLRLKVSLDSSFGYTIVIRGGHTSMQLKRTRIKFVWPSRLIGRYDLVFLSQT